MYCLEHLVFFIIFFFALKDILSLKWHFIPVQAVVAHMNCQEGLWSSYPHKLACQMTPSHILSTLSITENDSFAWDS